MGSRGLIGACLAWILVLGGATYERASIWASDLALWTDATRQSPQKPRPFINLGLAREQAGDWPGAIRAQQAALALSFQPRLSQYQQKFSRIASETNIARILALTGQEEAALRILDDVIARHPLFPHSRYNRAVLYARTGRCAQGDADGRLAMLLDPDLRWPGCS